MQTRKPVLKFSKSLLAVASLGCALGAQAADDGTWYLGAGVGRSKAVDLNNIDGTLANYGLASGSAVGSSDTAWKLFGGYQFNPNVGVEGGYARLGSFNINSAITAPAAGSGTGNWTANNVWSLSAVGTLPLQERLAVFGKVGAAYANVNLTYAGGGAAISANSSGFSPLYGLGVKYDLSRNASLRGEFERYQNLGDSNLTGQSSVNVFSLSAQYHF